MRSSIIASVFALAASVSALTITFPATQNATLDLSKENVITWTTVTSDPKTAILVLVNQESFPNYSLNITDKINTADGKYTLAPVTGPSLRSGYQFNFLKPATAEENSSGIIAQSQRFTIEKVADKATASKTASTEPVASETGAAPAATSSKPSSANALTVGTWGLVGAGLVAAMF